MKFSQALSCLLVPLALLTACGRPAAVNPGTSGFQVQSDEILPGSKGDRNGILPGSKGDRNGILPGSKGDRSHLAALIVRVELPASSDFVVLALADPQPGDWVASVDGQAVPTRLLTVAKAPEATIASFELSEVPLGGGVQELLFKSPDGNVRAAALLPALQAQQHELAAPLTPLSMAVWQLLKAERGGADLQTLSPASIEAEAKTPAALNLAAELEAQLRAKDQTAKPTEANNPNPGSHPGQTADSGQNQGPKPAQDDSSDVGENLAASDAAADRAEAKAEAASKAQDADEAAGVKGTSDAAPKPSSPQPKQQKSDSADKGKAEQAKPNDEHADESES